MKLIKYTLGKKKATLTNIDATAKTVTFVIDGASKTFGYEGEAPTTPLLTVVNIDASGEAVGLGAAKESVDKKSRASGSGSAFDAKY